ncbi:hypothetical protein SB860_11165 [Burkholderia sp. SIMBA_019]
MLFDHDVPVTMTDGLKLRVNIYRPEKAGHYPVLMLMGHTGKTPAWQTHQPTRHRGQS